MTTKPECIRKYSKRFKKKTLEKILEKCNTLKNKYVPSVHIFIFNLFFIFRGSGRKGKRLRETLLSHPLAASHMHPDLGPGNESATKVYAHD